MHGLSILNHEIFRFLFLNQALQLSVCLLQYMKRIDVNDLSAKSGWLVHGFWLLHWWWMILGLDHLRKLFLGDYSEAAGLVHLLLWHWCATYIASFIYKIADYKNIIEQVSLWVSVRYKYKAWHVYFKLHNDILKSKTPKLTAHVWQT